MTFQQKRPARRFVLVERLFHGLQRGAKTKALKDDRVGGEGHRGNGRTSS